MPRRILYDIEIMQNPELLQLYLWCLVKANYYEREIMYCGKKIIIRQGEFITGRQSGSFELGIHPETFRKRLETLVRMGRIEKIPARGYTHIRVVGYDRFLWKRREKLIKEQNSEGENSSRSNCMQ